MLASERFNCAYAKLSMCSVFLDTLDTRDTPRLTDSLSTLGYVLKDALAELEPLCARIPDQELAAPGLLRLAEDGEARHVN